MLALIPSLFSWQWPTRAELILLVLVGVISSVAQWFGVTAYKFGEANVVSNVEYTKMVYSLLLGYMLFSETPNMLSLMGAAIIIVSVFLPNFLLKLTKWQPNTFAIKRRRQKIPKHTSHS